MEVLERASPRGSVVVACVSTLLGLAFLEAGVRWLIPVRNVGPSFSEYDADHGKRLKSSFSCTRITPEFTMRLTTNSHGHRGPEAPEIPSGAVWFLGDSFTEGYGVNDGEEYPALVRTQYGRPVVNAGVGDTGNGRWLKILRGEAAAHRPSAIVLQMCGNDFFDNVHEAMYRIEHNGALAENAPHPPGRLRQVQRVVDTVPLLSYSYTLGAIRQLGWFAAKGATTDLNASDPATDPLTYRIVGDVLAECRKREWSVQMVLAGLNPEREARIRELAREVPVLTVPDRPQRPDLYYRVDMHWNRAGHRWVADQLGPVLARQAPPALPNN